MARTNVTRFVGFVALTLVSMAPMVRAQECREPHNHAALPWDLPGCPWQEQLQWCVNDTGHNEGADRACEIILAARGFTIPWPACKGLGEVWKRREMMTFAKNVAHASYIPQSRIITNTVSASAAVDVATACQWHNCHAFKCVAFHVPSGEVLHWLATH
jgi:hypothetical protein